ncbi:MAG: hypothetical protein ACRD2K_04335, partial [Terriglobales bacterium]
YIPKRERVSELVRRPGGSGYGQGSQSWLRHLSKQSWELNVRFDRRRAPAGRVLIFAGSWLERNPGLEDLQRVSAETKILGQFGPWLWFRLCQVLTALFLFDFVRAIYSADPGAAWTIVGAFLLLSMFAHQFAHGFGDDRGITFRKYFRKYFVTWEDVQSVSFSRRYPAIVVTLRHSVGFSKWVHFGPPSRVPVTLKEGILEPFVRPVPEAFLWMKEKIPNR